MFLQNRHLEQKKMNLRNKYKARHKILKFKHLLLFEMQKNLEIKKKKKRYKNKTIYFQSSYQIYKREKSKDQVHNKIKEWNMENISFI